MAYFIPVVDGSGLHIPAYSDIKEMLLDGARGIFGPDIYLESDSQDYEYIALIADRIHDAFMALQQAYNNRGPSTAVGLGLDGVVKINGIRRKRETVSECKVTVIGAPNTEIINGVAGDIRNVGWRLPETVRIDWTGRVEAIATCQRLGHDVEALGLNRIVTPTKGWERVINEEASMPGQKFEDDAALRARQSISTAKPSKTVLEGTDGGIAEISGVSRHRVYENDTNIEDGNTLPGHSICVVAEGGGDQEIAREIFLRKTPGCYTYGDVVVDVITENIYGEPESSPIRFFRPVCRDVAVVLHMRALPGYVSRITDEVLEAVSKYLNSIRIGDDLTISALWAVAQTAMPNLSAPIFSITAITAGSSFESQAPSDMAMAFKEVVRGKLENIKAIID
jgi:uncharacterized phage protein gp47/JayE